jgi:alkylated DNA repair dioxygenase AlkB
LKLFESANPQQNLLPFDGEVYYHGVVMKEDHSAYYFNRLLHSIEWKHDEAYLFGKHFITQRKVAWYGDKPFSYEYSNSKKQALPWTRELEEVKQKIEKIIHETFNSCLLNLYHSGLEGMAYHSDGEPDLAPNGTIASLSLGAERKFLFKHIETGKKISLFLENGSLLVMKGTCQQYWKHRLPPSKKVTNPRINLTFRTIVT